MIIHCSAFNLLKHMEMMSPDVILLLKNVMDGAYNLSSSPLNHERTRSGCKIFEVLEDRRNIIYYTIISIYLCIALLVHTNYLKADSYLLSYMLYKYHLQQRVQLHLWWFSFILITHHVRKNKFELLASGLT